jgi:hypothetical protein
MQFSIDNVKFKTADAHKHLGVTFSAACKWSKHINNVVVKQANNYDLRNANNFTFCLNVYVEYWPDVNQTKHVLEVLLGL